MGFVRVGFGSPDSRLLEKSCSDCVQLCSGCVQLCSDCVPNTELCSFYSVLLLCSVFFCRTQLCVRAVFSCVRAVFSCVRTVYSCVRAVYSCVRSVYSCVRTVCRCVRTVFRTQALGSGFGTEHRSVFEHSFSSCVRTQICVQLCSDCVRTVFGLC